MDDLATLHALAGAAAVALALCAILADRRRFRRRDPDAVGLVPWTAVFFWSLLAACLLLGLAAREWSAG
jgi:hypothetical protein